ncbi:hypothetical protein B0H13DRAFT_2656422 [Mycena leptocephala]|nr:hypothetical protein B0H13DRAFT_2656422 [Mycena leptocephala]
MRALLPHLTLLRLNSGLLRRSTTLSYPKRARRLRHTLCNAPHPSDSVLRRTTPASSDLYFLHHLAPRRSPRLCSLLSPTNPPPLPTLLAPSLPFAATFVSRRGDQSCHVALFRPTTSSPNLNNTGACRATASIIFKAQSTTTNHWLKTPSPNKLSPPPIKPVSSHPRRSCLSWAQFSSTTSTRVTAADALLALLRACACNPGLPCPSSWLTFTVAVITWPHLPEPHHVSTHPSSAPLWTSGLLSRRTTPLIIAYLSFNTCMSPPTLLSPSYNGARMAVIAPRPMTFHLAAEGTAQRAAARAAP